MTQFFLGPVSSVTLKISRPPPLSVTHPELEAYPWNLSSFSSCALGREGIGSLRDQEPGNCPRGNISWADRVCFVL